jgi:HEAT repeat protein
MTITGREPRLIVTRSQMRGYQRLSPRRLATLLNVLPADAIALDAAGAMLFSDDFYVRYNAARRLSERGDREARLVLVDALNRGDARTRASVVRHLHRFSWYAAEDLLRQAWADEDARVREAAVYALCDLHELAAYEWLADILAGESDAVREAAAWGLRDHTDSAAVPVLAMVLRADDPEVRIKALEALAANGTPDVLAVATDALDDPHHEVAYYAALALIEVGGAAVLPDLIAAVARTTGSRLEPLLRGLFHAANYLHLDLLALPESGDLLDALTHALADDQPEARLAAVWLLAGMPDSRAAALLVDVFQAEADPAVQSQVLRIAISLMAAGATDPLIRAGLDSPHAGVRALAGAYRDAIQAGTLAQFDPGDVAARPLTRDELRWQ